MLYSLQDITLVPATISKINSRSECNPYYENKKLPIFVAPMSQILDENNWETFNKYVNTIIPRNIPLETRLKLSTKTFVALSLDEFENRFCYDQELETTHYILIDVANGHMEKLLNACLLAKTFCKDKLVLMAGNVANPETYFEYARAGIDYCRMSIGSGSQCTTANTGIFYPMGSLLTKTNMYKESVKAWFNNSDCPYKSVPKIIADGGFNTFGDIIKALALGADYVMLGKVFAKSVEACGPILTQIKPMNYDVLKDGPFNEWIRTQKIERIKLLECYREYYGMSTKRAQIEFGKEGVKTEEGIASIIRIEHFLEDWIQRFTDYLKSAMSYTNHKSINTFVGGVLWEILSPTAIRTFK
jgi:hypothetical protein